MRCIVGVCVVRSRGAAHPAVVQRRPAGRHVRSAERRGGRDRRVLAAGAGDRCCPLPGADDGERGGRARRPSADHVASAAAPGAG